MGDRCWLSLTMRQSDREALMPFLPWTIGDEECEDNPDGTLDLTVDEANYAWTEELTKAAEEGHVPFYGCHGNGGCYGNGVFASDGKDFIEKGASDEGLPTVEFDLNGRPDTDSMDAMRRYILLRNKAVEIVHKKGTEC